MPVTRPAQLTPAWLTEALGARVRSARFEPLDSLGMTGCYLHVDPIATILAQSHYAALPLPSDSSAIGSNLYLQWLWEDASANPLGVVTSSLMEIFVR